MALNKWWLRVFLSILIVGIVLIVIRSNNGRPDLRAESGVLDLRDVEPASGTAALEGEWKFVWGELLEPKAFPSDNSDYMFLPRIWNGYEIEKEKLPAHGYATFQLKVILSHNFRKQNLALYIPYIHSSYTLFIDDNQSAKAGRVANNIENFSPSAQSLLIPVQANSDTITLTLQVANFAYSMGGVWQSLQLGSQQAVRGFYDRQLAFDLFILGGLLIMGLYHIALYFLRKTIKSNLYFGLACLLFALKNLFSGTVFIYTLIPDISYELCLKAIYISLFGPLLLFWLFLRELFKKEFPLIVSKILGTVVALCILVTVFTSAHTFSYLMMPFWIMVACTLIFILRGLYLVLQRQREGVYIILSGVAFFLFTVLHDIAIDLNLIKNIYLAGAGFFVLIFSQALLLAVKFTKSFKHVETLTLEKQRILVGQKEELEREVKKQTAEISEQHRQVLKEKRRSEELLLNILPEAVAEELKLNGKAQAKYIDQVSVLFTDFKGFTALSQVLSPEELVQDLHECFSKFDAICEKYSIEKIKTIGDAYMAAGGLPSPNTTHAEDALKAALEMVLVVEETKARKMAVNRPFFEIRIGINTGPVVAGIVGLNKFAYDIWGDTVNTASRMESSGQLGEVNISRSTYDILKENSKFTFESRGKVKAKGKGNIEMYFARWSKEGK